MLSKRPFEKEYSEELFKAVKKNDYHMVSVYMAKNKFLVFDFDHVN